MFDPPRRVGIFRALVLGDLLCAVPAIRAMKRAWPEAELSLIGLPWARDLVDRLDSVDRFIACPAIPGLPETGADFTELPEFLASMQAEQFDLMMQLHGSGGIVNSLLAACGPKATAGFVESRGYAKSPALHVEWPEQGHEIDRMLRAVQHLDIDPDGRHLEFPLLHTDRALLTAEVGDCLDGRPIACVHAGAQLPSRRWPAERFAAIAMRLHDAGWQVVLTGAASEHEIAASVAGLCARPVLDLVGRTTLWTLGALLERARLLVCNDTGVSHVAAALGTPSVVISSGADVSRWAPLDRVRHRVLWAQTACRPCGYTICPYAHECATAVSVDDVWQAIGSMSVMSAMPAMPAMPAISAMAMATNDSGD